jgi:predicted  nucleic acid-binding Zn-ribbon protein
MGENVGPFVTPDQQRILDLEVLVRNLSLSIDHMSQRIDDLENEDNHGATMDLERQIDDVENRLEQLQADFDDSQLGE